MDKKKSFLRPVPLLVASLLAAGTGSAITSQALAAYSSEQTQGISSSSTQELLLKNADQEGNTPMGHSSHSSHASHASHSSHSSHHSGFMGQ